LPERLIPKHGGYRNLKSFQIAQLVYDVTVRFCDRYIDRLSRTKDQMVQAAGADRDRDEPPGIDAIQGTQVPDFGRCAGMGFRRKGNNQGQTQTGTDKHGHCSFTVR
jgi:hypothetical protein